MTDHDPLSQLANADRIELPDADFASDLLESLLTDLSNDGAGNELHTPDIATEADEEAAVLGTPSRGARVLQVAAVLLLVIAGLVIFNGTTEDDVAPVAAGDPSNTVLEVLDADGRFTNYIAALEQTGLDAPFGSCSDSPQEVLAFTDESIEAFLGDYDFDRSVVFGDTELLHELLLYLPRARTPSVLPEVPRSPGSEPIGGLAHAGEDIVLVEEACSGPVYTLSDFCCSSLPRSAVDAYFNSTQALTKAESVAKQFMSLGDKTDATMIRSLLTDDALLPEEMTAVDGSADFERAIGIRISDVRCVAGSRVPPARAGGLVGREVACTFVFEDEISKAVGIERYDGNALILTVRNDLISEIRIDRQIPVSARAMGRFLDWLKSEHPDDVAMMIEVVSLSGGFPPGPLYTSESIALWELRVPQFVLAQQGSS